CPLKSRAGAMNHECCQGCRYSIGGAKICDDASRCDLSRVINGQFSGEVFEKVIQAYPICNIPSRSLHQQMNALRVLNSKAGHCENALNGQLIYKGGKEKIHRLRRFWRAHFWFGLLCKMIRTRNEPAEA